MEEQLAERQFSWNSFKRWRTIQLASLLPLILIGVFMLYFKEASPLGIMAFFLILIVGILLPQIRADLTLSHLVLAKGLEEGLQKLEERVVNLFDERNEQSHARELVKEPPVSQSVA